METDEGSEFSSFTFQNLLLKQAQNIFYDVFLFLRHIEEPER